MAEKKSDTGDWDEKDIFSEFIECKYCYLKKYPAFQSIKID